MKRPSPPLGSTPFGPALALLCLLTGCDVPPDDPTPGVEADGNATVFEGQQQPGASDTPSPDPGSLEDGSTAPSPAQLAETGGSDRLGVVTLDDADDRTLVSAVFTRLPDGQRADRIAAELSGSGDRCAPLIDEPPLDTLSAGDALVFSATSGTWATAVRRNDSGITIYTSDTRTGVAPDVVDVDVPGEVFPAIRAQLPEAPASLAAIRAQIGVPLSSTAALEWEASDTEARLQLIVAVGQSRSLCSLDDDGTVVPGLLPGLSEATFIIVSASRIHRQTVTAEGATLLLERRASIGLPTRPDDVVAKSR